MKSEKISEFLQARIEAKDFPSAVYLIAERGEIVFTDAFGYAVIEPEKIEANIETIYDLASLTKVLVTGLLCAKLIENGKINLSDKVSTYSAFFHMEDKQEVLIQNLLTHTSGFAAWKPFYLLWKAILNTLAELPNEIPVNTKVVYSDLNFITLALIRALTFQNTSGAIIRFGAKFTTETLIL